MLPAFLRYDCSDGSHTPLRPAENPIRVVDCAAFGDDWSEPLGAEEVGAVARYFQTFQRLGRFLDFVNLRVGGRDHVIPYRTRGFQRGVTFEAPRSSLMQAVSLEIFDDLLIGNFMKTTLHGRWPESRLEPHFTPCVAEYGDRGRAHTEEELRKYFREYRRRAPLDFLHHRLEVKATDAVRATARRDSEAYLRLKRAVRAVRAHV
jgi:hypothetical protein